MARNLKPGKHLIGNRVAIATAKAEAVQENIELAEAELHLANAVITDKLADVRADPQLARAVTHATVIEDKLHDASEELQDVTELLHSEQHDREQLEKALAEYRDADGIPVAGSRTGAGSASVIEHLRELTRHKLNSDHADPVARIAPGAGPGAT